MKIIFCTLILAIITLPTYAQKIDTSKWERMNISFQAYKLPDYGNVKGMADSVREYNRKWLQRMARMRLQTLNQSNDECVCNTQANIATALRSYHGVPLKGGEEQLITVAQWKEEIAKHGYKCDDGKRMSPFRNEEPFSTEGQLAGEFIESKGEDLVNKIANALDAGHVVAYAGNPNVIWEKLAVEPNVLKRLKYSISGAHAVRIAGVLRDGNNNVGSFWVADTAFIGGPTQETLDLEKRGENLSSQKSPLHDAEELAKLPKSMWPTGWAPYNTWIMDSFTNELKSLGVYSDWSGQPQRGFHPITKNQLINAYKNHLTSDVWISKHAVYESINSVCPSSTPLTKPSTLDYQKLKGCRVVADGKFVTPERMSKDAGFIAVNKEIVEALIPEIYEVRKRVMEFDQSDIGIGGRVGKAALLQLDVKITDKDGAEVHRTLAYPGVIFRDSVLGVVMSARQEAYKANAQFTPSGIVGSILPEGLTNFRVDKMKRDNPVLAKRLGLLNRAK